MEGEDEKSDDPRAFGNRPVWQRMIVVAAGGIMNILLAVLLMMVICGQEDRYATMQIAGFAENSAFEAAGVEVGDVITSIDGYTVRTGQDLSFALSMAALDSTDGTAALDLTVKRGEETVTFNDMTINTTSADGQAVPRRAGFLRVGRRKNAVDAHQKRACGYVLHRAYDLQQPHRHGDRPIWIQRARGSGRYGAGSHAGRKRGAQAELRRGG